MRDGSPINTNDNSKLGAELFVRIYNLRRFSRPEFLARISPPLLLEFIGRFPGCDITGNDKEINYEQLALFLANSEPGMDPELFDGIVRHGRDGVGQPFR
jgi:hypothetical protein